MSIVEPTLSLTGWVRDPSARLAKAFVYFMTTEADQTSDFDGEVVSIPYIITLYGNKPNECAQRLQQDIRLSLGRRFDRASVDITPEFDPDEVSYVLRFDVVVEQDGKKYSLGQAVSVDRVNLTANLIKEINK